MADLVGPDVSNHQGQIDWDRATRSGLVQFAILKASEGVNFVDRWFARNWAETKRLKVPRGAYHYALPSENTPEAEARFFVKCLDAAGGLEPGDSVWLDMEDPDYPVGADAGLWSVRFLEALEKLIGFPPGIYTYPSYVPERSMNEQALARFPLWYADYDGNEGPIRGPWKSIALWQYTASKPIPGMGLLIDHNIFHGTADDFRALGKPGAGTGVGEVKEPQPGDFNVYVNAEGATVLVINYGGQATSVEGFVIVDAGVSVKNAAGEIFDRSVKANVIEPWRGPR